MKKIFKVILISMLFMACDIHSQIEIKHRTWVYGFEALNHQDTINSLHDHGIIEIFLSINAKKLVPNGSLADANYTNSVSNFIELAHNHNIKVHAMTLMDFKAYLTTNHGNSVNYITWIVDYLESVSPINRFDGIHLDTEPQGNLDWKTAKDLEDWPVLENHLSQYVTLLSLLDPIIEASSSTLEFSAAIHWKFNEWAVAGSIPSGSTSNLISYLDFVVPMVYETSDINLLFSRSEDEVILAPTVVGIRAIDFASYLSLKDSADSLDELFSSYANFKGICLYKFSTLNQF